MSRKWLDRNNCFLFGKHKGEHIEDVADEDMSYLGWILREADDIYPYDRETIEEHYDPSPNFGHDRYR